ncbi:ATP-binding cassette domain-containing protein [sulfur-oxidizing endosymbiont of Gigantopelta aegis]|uniref:ATP-binding cassette domain-containing protein n=1 Tax=sulfur-oxidizing endosymbiont of Gigantopelta aegis TaxID=2794934 RepID=UPI0018DDA537|nr:ATP-binding cassette domain-containing protein [sulfur-oxidizing endosymbiont of Gigantopelta aegis]
MSIFSIDGLCLAFGTHVLLDKANFSLEMGERVCLIGRNGTGKTTLMRLIQGEMQADEGDVRKKDGLIVSSLSQEVPHEARGSVFDIIASGLGDAARLLQEYNHVLHDVANGDEQALNKMEKIQHELESVNGWSLVQKVEETISRLQLSADSLIEDLSGGLKRRVMLAKALVIEPDILMLDEPTNHLDIESILWLENFLKSYSGCVLFITHDRIFLQNVATRILELDRGQLVSFPGDYQTYLRRKEEMLHAEEKANDLFDKKLAEEEVWIRQGIKARRTRNEGRVRALKAMRNERSERRDLQGKAKMELDDKKNSGKLVVEVDNISYQYDKQVIVKDFSTVIMRGDRIGIIGPNGVGKTTMLNLLLGELTPQSGQVKLGTKLEIAYFDQLRNQLDEEKSIIENIGQGREFVSINGRDRHVFSYLGDFLFSSERAKVSVKALSGGGRNRLLLAKLFTKPANLLILDEPTNDLDSETLELLESLLIEYKGTLIIVSHDRAFLNNVITSSLVFEADGINEYVGGYDDWLRQRKSVVAPVSKSTNAPVSAVVNAQVKPLVKLSYKEQRELDNLPAKIETLESQQAELETQIAQPEFYQQDQGDVARKLSELEAVNQQLDTIYTRWDELEEKKSGS